MRSFIHFLLTAFFLTSPLLAVDNQAPHLSNRSNSWWITRTCADLFGYVSFVVSYPIVWLGKTFARGATEQALQRFLPANQAAARPDPNRREEDLLDKNMDALVGALFKALQNATDPKKKSAEGAKFVRNLFAAGAIAVAELYNPKGEGRKALENIIKSLRAFIHKHGAIQKVLRDARIMASKELVELVRDFEKMNRHEGVAREAVHSVAENLSLGVDRVGQSIDVSSRKVVRNVLIGSVLTISAWFAWKHVERMVVKPRLVLETSYKNPLEKMQDYLSSPQKIEEQTMIFSAELEQRLASVSLAAKAIKEKIRAGQRNITYRNLLLWGPPGTGKTMFARLLARRSGMDYVIISGASFTQFQKGEGITEMNKLFAWANSSSLGVVLFIDEAEAFLGGRAGKDVTDQGYQLLTNFLNLSGERSKKIMFIFSTNYAEALDPAIKRRIDDSIEMKLPALDQRAAILRLYRDQRMINTSDSTKEFKESVIAYLNDDAIIEIARQTDGLSGSELEGIINTLIAEVSIASNGRLSKEIIVRVILQAKEKQQAFVQGFKDTSG